MTYSPMPFNGVEQIVIVRLTSVTLCPVQNMAHARAKLKPNFEGTVQTYSQSSLLILHQQRMCNKNSTIHRVTERGPRFQ